MLKWYLENVKKVLVQPILFYTKMPPGEWTEEPVTFCALTSWVLSLGISLFVFMNQLVPIGVTLLIQVSGWKLLLVAPVTLVLAFMFFVITYSILGGVLMAIFLALFYVLGAASYWASKMAGGKGLYLEAIKSSLYASAVLLAGLFVVLFMFLIRWGVLSFTNFKIGYNIVYSFCVLYLYGLFAIAARKTQSLDRSKAFIAALLPAFILVIFGLVVNKAILPKIIDWIR